ncbi:MAG: hypothetical protein GEV04_25310, partial [Actinophytocola sp.]|nr:hypothetical protein [Actinophytocola sp.]
DAVDTLPDSMRHIVGYHLGWWDSDGNATGAPSGKALRPTLVLLTATATGTDTSAAIPAAVAVELAHNSTLLRNRKKSLPVVYALSSGTPAGRELAKVFQADTPRSHDDLVRAARLVDDAGGRAWCRSQSDALLARALGHLRSAAPHPAAETELTTLAEFVVHRDR